MGHLFFPDFGEGWVDDIRLMQSFLIYQLDTPRPGAGNLRILTSEALGFLALGYVRLNLSYRTHQAG
jgi:hypothetical protein